MKQVNIKPLSVNDAWQGRRFKTQDYKDFEQELNYILPKYKVPKNSKLKVYYQFGLSNKIADGDNCIKQFQDIISKKYGFNDCKIYRWEIDKIDCEKGKEFIKFKIEKI